MPEIIHASYNTKGHAFRPAITKGDYEDVFVLENLLESGYENFDGSSCLKESHMKAVLECLCQLHGTGMAYKVFSTSENNTFPTAEESTCTKSPGLVARQRIDKIKEEFPGLEEQIQLAGIVKTYLCVILPELNVAAINFTLMKNNSLCNYRFAREYVYP